jgi:hypothetical protein
MDMQQMMQQLLARKDAWRKEMKPNQEKAEADRIAHREKMKQMLSVNLYSTDYASGRHKMV